MQTSKPVLEIGNLNLHLGDYPVLKDVSFSVHSGEILGVLGPNGAGKTSLLNCISGQLDGFEGRIELCGRPIKQFSAAQLARQLAVVKQFNQMVFALNVRQVTHMGLLPHKSLLSRDTKADQQRIDTALAQVGLFNRCHQLFSSLSGGEQQRALIARALVQGADVLVLDEPTNHLDLHYQHQILQLLKQLCRQLGLTLVMSVHDLNLAAMYCDRLCLLDRGQLTALGTVEQVLEPELLSGVFDIRCVRRRDEAGGIRIDTYPLNMGERL